MLGPMKVMGTDLLGILLALPWMSALLVQAPAIPPDVWQTGKDISFAGLVWFLVGLVIPKLMAQHREERDQLVGLLIETEANHRVLLGEITSQHAATIERGHEVCSSLAAEVRSIKEHFKQP